MCFLNTLMANNYNGELAMAICAVFVVVGLLMYFSDRVFKKLMEEGVMVYVVEEPKGVYDTEREKYESYIPSESLVPSWYGEICTCSM